jgi:hypothetical protein
MSYRHDGLWLEGVSGSEMDLYRVNPADEYSTALDEGDDLDEEGYLLADPVPSDAARAVGAVGSWDPMSNRHGPITVDTHVHGDFGPHSHFGDGDHSDAPMMDEEELEAGGDDDDAYNPFATKPAANAYAAIQQPDTTVQDGSYGDVTATARAIAAQRHPGVDLTQLPADEQQQILKQAADASGYAGAYMGRTAQAFELPPEARCPADTTSLWASPAIGLAERERRRAALREQLWDAYQAHEEARIDLEGEAIQRVARKVARTEFGGKKLSELSSRELQDCYVRVSEIMGVRR